MQAVPRLASAVSISAYVVLIAVTVLTTVRATARRLSRERVRGNVLIAVGATIVAVGGTALTRVGRGSAFSIALALGVGVMFGGFRLAARPARSPLATEAET